MIVEEEQSGKVRAEYGRKLLEGLSAFLNGRVGKGFSESTLIFPLDSRCFEIYRELMLNVLTAILRDSIDYKNGIPPYNWNEDGEYGSMDYSKYSMAFRFVQDYIYYGSSDSERINNVLEDYFSDIMGIREDLNDSKNKLENWWSLGLEDHEPETELETMTKNLLAGKYTLSIYGL